MRQAWLPDVFATAVIRRQSLGLPQGSRPLEGGRQAEAQPGADRGVVRNLRILPDVQRQWLSPLRLSPQKQRCVSQQVGVVNRELPGRTAEMDGRSRKPNAGGNA
jgi:hypothetical protein